MGHYRIAIATTDESAIDRLDAAVVQWQQSIDPEAEDGIEYWQPIASADEVAGFVTDEHVELRILGEAIASHEVPGVIQSFIDISI